MQKSLKAIENIITLILYWLINMERSKYKSNEKIKEPFWTTFFSQSDAWMYAFYKGSFI